jgi:hypothetical protein
MHSPVKGNCRAAGDLPCISSVLNLQLLPLRHAMDLSTMSARRALEADDLIETDPVILDQVRKDLNQEYVRLMSRALQTALRSKQGEGTPEAATPDSNEESS